MKRIALILIILSCCCCFASAQEGIGSGLNPSRLSFATLVKSDAWKNAQTFQQRVALCQIPDEVLPKLSTAQLVELCVSNPLNVLIYAYDNPWVGVHYVTEHFNAFQELKKRNDAESKLIDFYESIDFKNVSHSPYPITFSVQDDNVYSLSDISFLELLLASDEFPRLFKESNYLKRLDAASARAYEMRLKQPKIFSGTTLSKSLMVQSKIALQTKILGKAEKTSLLEFYDCGGNANLSKISEILFK